MNEPISLIAFSSYLDVPIFIEQLTRCRFDGYVSYETRIIHPSDKMRWVRLKLKKLDDGTVIGVAKNITREKNIENKLHIQNEKLEDLITYRTFELEKTKIQYHSLINGATDIIYSINRDKEVMILNDAGCLLIGLPLKDILNKQINDVFPSEFAAFLNSSLQSVFLKGNPINKEHEMNIGNMSIHFQTVLSPIVSKRGNVTEVVGISRDISNLKELQKEIDVERQTSIQSNKLASIGRMATGVAHEINQPLNHIKLSVSMNQIELEKHDFQIAKIKDYNNAILSDINRISEIIKHIREFGRIESDYLIPVDAHDTIQKTELLIKDLIKKHHIQLHYNFQAKYYTFLGGKNRFEQIILNLTTNAIDAMEESEVKKLEIRTQNKRDRLIIQFIDTGHGISEEIIKNIFDPFFTTKPVGKGTGIGLSIIFQLIKSFQGKIYAESYSEGAIFTIEFPVYSGENDEHIMC